MYIQLFESLSEISAIITEQWLTISLQNLREGILNYVKYNDEKKIIGSQFKWVWEAWNHNGMNIICNSENN